MPASQYKVELQALLDAAVDAVIQIDHRGIMQQFNRSAERLFGYAAAEALGHNVTLLMTGGDERQHNAYLERYERSGVGHIIGIGREVQGRRKDGSVFPAFLSVGRIAGSDPPRFVGFLHDVTLRQQALAAVERERDRANRYLKAAQTILVGLDPAHRITLISRKGCEILGHEEQALLGSYWFENYVAAEHRGTSRAEFDALLGRVPRQPHYCEYPVVTRGGATRLIAWRSVVVEDNLGAVSGVLCSGDDVTEIRRADEEMREARERMMQVSRLAMMGEMAGGISHELNQPLAAIANYAQAARRLLVLPDADPADLQEALGQITDQALRAGDIIRRLRSLVRGRASSREPCDLNEVITELTPLVQADARGNDIRLVLELSTALSRVILDRIQMQMVLLNLLRNAINALRGMPPGRRQVVVRTAQNTPTAVQFEVIDNGPGVPEALRHQMFETFVSSKDEGMGLGLAISRTIVEAHRGRLEYEPTVPQGATLRVTLPAEPAR